MPRRSEPRIPALPVDDWDPDITRLAGDNEPFNVFKTLANHPQLLRRWTVFANHVLFKSTLPARERELVILRIGWRCQSEYEFGQHTRIGLDAGLTDDEIVALTRDIADGEWSDRDAALIRATDELHDDQYVTDETWAALAADWDTHQLMDIVFAIGQYTLVSMALNTFGVQLDDGVATFPG